MASMADPPTPPTSTGETRTVRVDLGERAYDVLIGEGILSELGPRLGDLLPSRRAFVVYDDNLPEALVAAALDSLRASGFETDSATVNAAESNKTIDTAARLLHDVAETRHERGDPIVALGGGITGDVAGFVAASYRRGVPIVQCPTTLLAMVDAAVGGKTGVNLRTRTGLKKNLVGAFWQPALVINDAGALASLDRRHLRSGLAECVKHALIVCSAPGPALSAPGELFEWTNDNIVKLRMNDTALLIDLIAAQTPSAGAASQPAPATLPATEHPGPHHKMEHHHHGFKNAEAWAKRFDAKTRDAWQKPDEVVAMLALKPTAHVVDLGSGTGYFAVRLARAVPEGHVWGADIEPDMVRYLNERAKKEGLGNLVSVAATPSGFDVGASPVDLVLVVNTYHHIEDRTAYFEAVKAKLAPGGAVAIVDFRAERTAHGPPPKMRIPAQGVIDEMAKAGYALRVYEDVLLPEQYVLVFAPMAPAAP